MMSSNRDTTALDVPALLGLMGGGDIVTVFSAIGVAVENQLWSDANLFVLICITLLRRCTQSTHHEFAQNVEFLFERPPTQVLSSGRSSI